MALTVGVDPRLSSVLRAIGLLGADGTPQASWFEHPLERVRDCLADPIQRAAVFALLDDVLPPTGDAFDDALRPPGSSWHPLADADYGAVFLTVTDDVVGVAATVHTTGAAPNVRATVSIPLLRTGPAGVAAVVGTAEGPITLGVRADLGADAGPSAVGLRFAVDETGARIAVRLEDGAQVSEFDPTSLDSRAVDAVTLLVRSVLEHGVGADPVIADLVTHLPGVLGIGDPALTPLPLTRPAQLRSWFAGVLGSGSELAAWLGHVAGIFGVALTPPAIAGDPHRVTVLDLPGEFSLDLLVAGTAAPPTLWLGLELRTEFEGMTLAARASVAAIPLDGSPARPFPAAEASLTVPVLGGVIRGGVVWDGVRVVPLLRLVDVTVAGTSHTLDLTDAHAVVAEVTDTVLTAVQDAIGADGTGRHVLALLGLVAPDGITSTLGPEVFTGNVLRAVAEHHRAILADTDQSWGALLGELAGLLGLDDAVTGTGSRDDPWAVDLAVLDPFAVRLVAWDEGGTGGTHGLRLGTQVATTIPGWELAWSGELLAFELAPDAATSTRFLGAQNLRVSIAAPPTADLDLLRLSADRVDLTAHWVPGTPAAMQVELAGLVVTTGDLAIGPVTLTLPELDLTGDDAQALTQALLRTAWSLFGPDRTPQILAALLGLHAELPDLPADWPTVWDGVADLRSLLADPLGALQGYARTVLGGRSSEGTPFALDALRWLATLVADQVPDAAGVLPIELVTGAGSYEDPWALPVAALDADVLVWLDPAPPADPLADPRAAIRDARNGEHLLTAIGPGDLTFARDPAAAGAALDRLGGWLAGGDGLTPYASQTAVPATWTVGAPVALVHDEVPLDPGVIGAVQAQLTAWGAARPVLLVTTATNTDWSALLRTLEPGHDPDARLDAAALDATTAVARCYPVVLGAGDPVAQVRSAAARVRVLTGAAQVVLVGHGPGGVAARQAADAGVAGVITLCAPHAGSTLDPLTDAGLADAVRIADALGAPHARLLRRILDGGPAVAGVLPPPGTWSAWAGVADPSTAATVGLAIGSRLGGDLIGDLATRAAAATPSPPPHPVTHVGAGVRLRLASTAPAVGEGDVAITLRSDLFRVRLAEGGDPPRPAQRLTVTADLGTVGGWLVGDPGARADAAGRAGTRVRWARLGVRLDRDPAGGTSATPVVRLVDAAWPGAAPRTLDVPELLAALAADPDRTVELPDGVPLATDCLRALGLLTPADAIDPVALHAALTTPAASLAARLPDLLGVLAPRLGAGPSGTGWALPLLDGALTLALTPQPWLLRLTTAADTTAAPGLVAGLDLDAAITLPAFTPSASIAVRAAGLTLAWTGGRLEVAAPPWLAPVPLAPGGDPAAIGAALAAAVPRTVLTTVLALLVAPASGGPVVPLDRLFLEPVQFLRDVLGNGAGGLSADRVNQLLAAIARGLGAAEDATGLALPGDLTLQAVEPFELRLTGSVPVPLAGSTLTLGLGLRIDDQLVPTPSGTIRLGVTLPGDWGPIVIDAGGSAAGLVLGVTPGAAARIALLPHFDGLGALAGGLTALLPHVLQQIVDELSPPSPWLATVLDVATALGIYGPDAQGFEQADRAATLAAMLQPGWLAGLAADAGLLTTRIAALFQLVPLPLGSVAAGNDRLTWTVPVAALGATAQAAFGWTGTEPTVTVSIADLSVGPVTVPAAAVGWDGTALALDVTVTLDAGGVLAALRAGVEVQLAGDRFSVRVLPLGPGTGDDFALVLAPQLQLVTAAGGPLQLVEQVALPLAAEVLLRAFDAAPGDLLTTPFWTPDGPTARAVLAAAGIVPAADPPVLAHPLPDPLAALLGAIQAVVTGIDLRITDDLGLGVVADPVSHRTGVRLRGTVDIPVDDDAVVQVCFGGAAGLGDTDAGVTLWLVTLDGTDVQLRPGLVAEGLGVVVTGDPLVDGTFTIGGAGGLVFFDAEFTDAAGDPALHVDRLGAGLALRQAFVNLSGEDGDSFVAKIVPPQLAAPFDLTVSYVDGTLQVSSTLPAGDGDLELILPIDVDLTIIQITELLLGLKIGAGSVSVTAAVSGGAHLGPVVARVKRVGVVATFGAGAGLRLRPPDEVGLSIDTSTLRLAGFLLVDEAHGRYVGAIEISILGKFELSAVGIITTRPAFSLLFIVSMELPVPIALGYGFFFAGAGGLLGLNRGFDVNALAGRLRSGAAESILFPTDVVERADAIVADLEAVFPLAVGQFVVGPMVKITWSTPPLISIEVGLFLSIGRLPPVIAIVGLVRAALPTKDEPVLDLKVAFVGAIDVAAKLLRFDASIYDSFIGIADFKLTLEGDIAVRLSWSEHPDFVLSVGGFHPAYKPDAALQLPVMRRISLSLLRDNPHLSLSMYLAITANSVQLGARLDFYFGIAGFSIEGTFGFDVLFQIAPFLFDARVYASLAVKAGGSSILSLQLDFSLRGPTPWIARGTASFSILFFTVSVSFEKTFGPSLTTSIPLIDVLPALIAELTRPQNWIGELDPATTSAITLLPLHAADGSVVVDATGSLTVSQRVLPLATPITRFGTSRPGDIGQAAITGVTFGDTAAGTSTVLDQFSPGAFGSLSDADKLSSPSFTRMPSGVRVDGGTALRTTYVRPRAARYDVIVVDSAGVETTTPKHPQDRAEFEALALGAAAGRSVQAQQRVVRLGAGGAVAVGAPDERYVVTGPLDLHPRTADGAPATPASIDGGGRPVWGPDVALNRVDAERRAAALGGHVLPQAQASS